MDLLYCDETNFEKSSGDFFVYGGLAIPAEGAAELHSKIEAIRNSMNVPRDYILKFNPGPQGMSHACFIQFKQECINAAVETKCVLISNMLLHDIAKSSEEARRYGINSVCYNFDSILSRRGKHGLVLIDRFDDKQIDGQLREKLSVGITGNLPHADEIRLENILGYHYSAVGQSHFCSLVDVILGSLRFAVNAFTQKQEKFAATSTAILNLISPLFPREIDDRIHEVSLSFKPKEILSSRYRTQYVELQNYLKTNNIDTAQAL